MKKLSLILAILLALCACALAEEAAPVQLLPGDIQGVWNLEYVTADGFMVTAQAYDLVVTLSLNEDGSAAIDYNGEPGSTMQWRIEDGRAYIAGYNPEGDIEILISDEGVLEITDEIGSMFFTRPAEEAA